MPRGKDVLREAERLARSLRTWADLSNALFDPMEGLVARSFPALDERKEFRKSHIYDQLHTLVEKKMEATGITTKPKTGTLIGILGDRAT